MFFLRRRFSDSVKESHTLNTKKQEQQTKVMLLTLTNGIGGNLIQNKNKIELHVFLVYTLI